MRRIGLIFLCLTAAGWAARPPFSAEDWWAWHTVSDPRITPDGAWTVFVDAWNDRAADARFSNLQVVATNGKSSRRITEGNWRDWYPRWSPDGARLAWISDRGGAPQIWVGTPDGPAKAVTSGPQAPLTLAWAPDGESLAFTARLPEEAPAPAWAPAALAQWLVRPRPSPVQIFVAAAAGGTARRITSGDFDFTGEPGWMADGRSVVIERAGDLYLIRIADGTAKQLTQGGGRNYNPVPSSDGGKIAWLASANAGQNYAVSKICVMNADGTRVKILSGSLNRDAREPQWSSDSRTIYFMADDRGTTHVYAVRNDGTLRQVTNTAERLFGFSLADNGRAAALRATPTEAGSIYTFTVDRVSQPVVLHASNEHLMAEREISAPEEFTFRSAANTVQGWIIKPPDFDAAKQYPLLLDIRDQPRAMYGVDFNLRAQLLAARGFLVLCVNPRGTPGYGEVFGNLLETRNPGDDFDDLMAAVDDAQERKYVDRSRLLVSGGMLAAYTIGHSTRFHSAVISHPAAAWGLRLWPDAQALKTPSLILAGDGEAAGEALYQALRAAKVEAALARIPAADRPSTQLLEMEAAAGWLSR